MEKKQWNEVDVMNFCKEFQECHSIRSMQSKLTEVAGGAVPHYLIANGELMRVWLEEEINVELLAENMEQLHRINWGREWCQINILTPKQVEQLTKYGPGVVQESGSRKSGIKIYVQVRGGRLFGRNKKKQLLCSIKGDYEQGNQETFTEAP